jgi:hypothetical protein
MKTINYLLLICLAVPGCKSVNYYTPGVNANTFANPGEVQATGNFSTSGFLAKGGVAVTKNLSVNALYNSSSGMMKGYHVKEGEFAAGWRFSPGRPQGISLFGGYGWGNNFDLDSGEVVKDYQGNFQKPFLIFNYGSARIAKKGFIHMDINMGFKLSYFGYHGFKTSYQNGAYVNTPFNPQHFLTEPYVMASLGGRHVQFESGMSFALKRIKEIGEGARVFPITIQFGIKILLNRKYEE